MTKGFFTLQKEKSVWADDKRDVYVTTEQI